MLVFHAWASTPGTYLGLEVFPYVQDDQRWEHALSYSEQEHALLSICYNFPGASQGPVPKFSSEGKAAFNLH